MSMRGSICADMYPAYDSASADGGVSDSAHCAGLPPPPKKRKRQAATRDIIRPSKKEKYTHLGLFHVKKSLCCNCMLPMFFDLILRAA